MQGVLKMLKENKPIKWTEAYPGGVIPFVDHRDRNTGTWRSMIPVIDPNKCVNCMICWMTCPDNAIKPDDGKFGHFDYKHCKGCGICANQCPVKAIDMKIESEVDKSKIPKAKNLE